MNPNVILQLRPEGDLIGQALTDYRTNTQFELTPRITKFLEFSQGLKIIQSGIEVHSVRLLS